MSRSLFLAFFLFAATAHGKPLFETKSKFSRIVIEERDNTRSLLFDGVTQSSVRMGEPKFLVHDYTQTSMLGLGLTDVHRVLVIGLGGGSMPMFIRAYDPKAVIDVVEIDPTVLDLATRYFGFREDPTMKVYVEDGADFMRRVMQQYDLIILDAYAPDFIPPQLATADFFKVVKEKLRSGGVLISNVWGPPNPSYDAMIKTQRSVFKSVSIVRARNSGNHIFVALDRPLEKAALLDATRALMKRYAFHFDLVDVIDRGFVK